MFIHIIQGTGTFSLTFSRRILALFPFLSLSSFLPLTSATPLWEHRLRASAMRVIQPATWGPHAHCRHVSHVESSRIYPRPRLTLQHDVGAFETDRAMCTDLPLCRRLERWLRHMTVVRAVWTAAVHICKQSERVVNLCFNLSRTSVGVGSSPYPPGYPACMAGPRPV